MCSIWAKPLNLAGLWTCPDLRENGYEVTLEEALGTGKMLLDWGCPVVILTQHICCAPTMCWTLC